jgi:hypothetical protein
MKSLKRYFHPVLLSVTLSVVLAACSSDDNNDTPVVASDTGTQSDAQEGGLKEVQFDATAGGFSASDDDPKNKYSYFNLDKGEVVELTDAEAESSKDWHIAFKRTKPKINGGDSGSGEVKAALADAQEDYYDAQGKPNNSVFLNASAEQELTSFNAVSSAEGLEFKSDRESPEIIGDGGEKSWFSYDPQNHTITANPDAWNIVSGAAGDSYAKLHVTDIVQADQQITVEMFIQGKGETAFSTTPATYTANLGANGGAKCFDFDTQSELDCNAAAADWDIQVEVSGRDWNIWTNGGLRGSGSKGGRFGTVSADTIGNYPSAASVPKFFIDAPSGQLLDRTTRWYAYSLEGNNKIWPNYRVYVVDTGATQYKLQVLKYYNDAGVSGWITLRYTAL